MNPLTNGWSFLMLLVIGPVFLGYLVYSIGRYDERQKTKALAAEWLRQNPDPAEIHKFIASLADRK